VTRRARRDDGTVLLLVLGFAIVAMLLVAVVVDVSALYLARRSLASAADAAAIAGVQMVDERAAYSGEASQRLPLDVLGSRAAVERHLADMNLYRRFDGLAAAVDTRPDATQVTLSADIRLPFAPPWLAGGVVRIDATAVATAPFVN
jgi:uncharacterized membrane protein